MEVKEFLVSLGWGVDERSERAWKDALRSADALVKSLASAFAGAATAVAALVAKTAIAFDDQNFSARRLNTSVANLQALAYAIKQTGGGSSGALEGFARQMRLLPSTEGIVNALGVATRQNGALRDNTDILLDVVDAMSGQSYVLAVHNAGLLGISEPEYNDLRRNAAAIRAYQEEFKARAKALGVSPDELAAGSTLLMSSVRGMAADIDLILGLIAGALAPALIPIINQLATWLAANQDKIVRFAEAVVEAIAGVAADLEGLVIALTPAGQAISDAVSAGEGAGDAVGLLAGGFLIAWAAKIAKPVAVALGAFLGLKTLFSVPTANASAGVGQTGGVAPKRSFWGGVRSILGFPPGDEEGGNGKASAGEKDASPASNDRPVQSLMEERARFIEELKDEAVAARLAAFTEAEVGSQGAQAQQAFIESIMNRAAARGQTLAQTLSGSYFPDTTHARARRFANEKRLQEKYRHAIQSVLDGSNVSGFATGNASGSVGFGGGPHTSTFGGEKFGIEKRDLEWSRGVRKKSSPRVDDAYGYPTPKDGLKRGATRLDTSPLMASSDEMFGTMVQETRIVVRGDTDPNRTAKEVEYAQRGVNTAVVERVQSIVA